MDDYFFLTILLATAIGCSLGYIITDDSWRNDCDKIGTHLVGDKVYECKLKNGLPR